MARGSRFDCLVLAFVVGLGTAQAARADDQESIVVQPPPAAGPGSVRQAPGAPGAKVLTLPPIDWAAQGRAVGVPARSEEALEQPVGLSPVRLPPRPGELDSYFDTPEYKNGQLTSTHGHIGAARQFGGLGAAVAGGAVIRGIDELLKDQQP